MIVRSEVVVFSASRADGASILVYLLGFDCLEQARRLVDAMRPSSAMLHENHIGGWSWFQNGTSASSASV